jgi:hypothetical protein
VQNLYPMQDLWIAISRARADRQTQTNRPPHNIMIV